VPKDATRSAVLAQSNIARSQREDHGLTAISPRGQRLAVLWGQANANTKRVRLGKAERRIQQADVRVEPGVRTPSGPHTPKNHTKPFLLSVYVKK